MAEKELYLNVMACADRLRRLNGQPSGNICFHNVARWVKMWLALVPGDECGFTLLVVLFLVLMNSDFSFIAWTKKVFGLDECCEPISLRGGVRRGGGGLRSSPPYRALYF